MLFNDRDVRICSFVRQILFFMLVGTCSVFAETADQITWSFEGCENNTEGDALGVVVNGTRTGGDPIEGESFPGKCLRLKTGLIANPVAPPCFVTDAGCANAYEYDGMFATEGRATGMKTSIHMESTRLGYNNANSVSLFHVEDIVDTLQMTDEQGYFKSFTLEFAVKPEPLPEGQWDDDPTTTLACLSPINLFFDATSMTGWPRVGFSVTNTVAGGASKYINFNYYSWRDQMKKIPLLTYGKWHHIALVYERGEVSGSSLDLYVDGERANEKNVPCWTSKEYVIRSSPINRSVSFGGGSTNGYRTANFLNGNLSSPRITMRALRRNELQSAFYSAQAPIDLTKDPVLFHLRFEEGESGEVYSKTNRLSVAQSLYHPEWFSFHAVPSYHDAIGTPKDESAYGAFMHNSDDVPCEPRQNRLWRGMGDPLTQEIGQNNQSVQFDYLPGVDGSVRLQFATPWNRYLSPTNFTIECFARFSSTNSGTIICKRFDYDDLFISPLTGKTVYSYTAPFSIMMADVNNGGSSKAQKMIVARLDEYPDSVNPYTIDGITSYFDGYTNNLIHCRRVNDIGYADNCYVSGTEPGDFRWHHIAVTFDRASRTMKTYFDYTNVSTRVISSGYNAALVPGGWYLGTSVNDGWAGYKGFLDEVRLTAAVLQPDEFLRHHGPVGTMMILR